MNTIGLLGPPVLTLGSGFGAARLRSILLRLHKKEYRRGQEHHRHGQRHRKPLIAPPQLHGIGRMLLGTLA